MFGRSPRERPGQREPGTTAPQVVVVEGDGSITERLARSCPEFRVEHAHHVDDAIKGALGPTMVVLGSDASNSATLDRVEELCDIVPSHELTVVLAVSKITTTLLRRALRAGISDVVDVAAAHDLEDALRRISSRAAQRVAGGGAMRGRVVAVFSPKGGVGTTTLAINLAAQHSGGPANVIVDADLPFGDVAIGLGVEPGNSLADATGSDLDLARLEGLLKSPTGADVRALVAPSDPARAELIGPADVARTLDLCREIANLVVVDTASAFDDITLSVFETADDIVVVTTPDVAAIKNVKVALQTLHQLGIPDERVHVVVNRVPAHPNVRVSDIEKALGVNTMSIPEDPAVGKATFHAVPVATEAPRSAATKALSEMAMQLQLADLSHSSAA